MRLTEKSQVTVPKLIREKLGIGPGSEIEFEIDGKDVRIVPAKTPDRIRAERALAIETWIGSVRGRGTAGETTDETMDETRGPFDDLDSR